MSEQTTTLRQVPSPERNGAVLFPAFLIALGGLFLLGNLGLIAPISFRSLLSLWPLIPVMIGISSVCWYSASRSFGTCVRRAVQRHP
jgi:hypothetical protein